MSIQDHEHKEPDLQDFGITPEEYALFIPTHPSGWFTLWITLFSFMVVFLVNFIVARHSLAVSFFMIFPIYLVVPDLVNSAIVRYKRYRLGSSVVSQIKRYQEALVAYHKEQEEAERARREAERTAERAEQEAEQARRKAERVWREAERARRRKLSDHWMSLSGPEFERELGTLYRHLGYRVESTPSSGDGGIDLVLRKNGKTTVVQCKSHQAPVGPAIARELLGSLVASGADDAILACTGGFTQGVRKFVRGKPITLISAIELAALGESVENRTQDRASGPPVCPVPECGKTMVSRMGKYGRFWGCPEYPKCRGTRDDPEGLG